MEGTCQCCRNLPGCPLLGDDRDRFDAAKVITLDNFRECRRYEDVGTREKKGVRERLYRLSGLGYLRALHELPETVMDGLRQGEKDELMYEEIPDFQDPTLLYEGMPVSERESVLRYETDSEGNVIVEMDSEGEEVLRARPAYHLKQYAVDENGPIQVDKSVCWFWTTNQLVDHILRTEAKEGLIVKEKKKKGEETPPQSSPADRQGRETTKMAEGKRVRVSRTSTSKSGAAPKRASAKPASGKESGGGRVARPPVRKGGAAKSAPKEEANTAPAADNGEIKEMKAELVELRGEVKELNAQIADLKTTFLDGLTVFHDIWAQTAGSAQFPKEDEEGNVVVDEDGNEVMESCPELFPKPSKILAYIDGTAFTDDEGEQ